MLLSIKNNEVTFFRKECNELLVILYLTFNATVPLQLLVNALKKVTKALLVTTKSN
jgi:hypothetical protein